MVTTCNYPDIGLQAYQANRFSFLFFFSFLVINLYLLMNLLLANTYSAFIKSVDDYNSVENLTRIDYLLRRFKEYLVKPED